MSSKLSLSEKYGEDSQGRKQYSGEVEIEIRCTKTGEIISQYREPNLIKIFAKEIISRRLPSSNIWDPTAGTGTGAWVSSGIDIDNDFSPKYILFGASFDDDGAPLDTADARFYTEDVTTGTFVPISLGVGAEFEGGLINAVPLADSDRPLKKVERIFFEPTYQPAGTPLLQEDVRAMNNIVVFETILRKAEYNGFGQTTSDFFTITEVALAGGKELDFVDSCECDPNQVFLEGSADGDAILASATGTATVTIDVSEVASVDVIKEGDQVKIVDVGDTAKDPVTLDQVTDYYFVISKTVGGSDVVLDRVPVDSAGTPITGSVGLFRDTLRIFSHRVLKTPVKKSEDFEITVRWRLIMN